MSGATKILGIALCMLGAALIVATTIGPGPVLLSLPIGGGLIVAGVLLLNR